MKPVFHRFSKDVECLLDNVSLIIIEEDQPHRLNGGYETSVNGILTSKGFERVWKIADSFNPKVAWSRNLIHSVWRKGGLGDKPTCQQFAETRGYTTDLLKCLQ